jgi:hypothetical protein
VSLSPLIDTYDVYFTAIRPIVAVRFPESRPCRATLGHVTYIDTMISYIQSGFHVKRANVHSHSDMSGVRLHATNAYAVSARTTRAQHSSVVRPEYERVSRSEGEVLRDGCRLVKIVSGYMSAQYTFNSMNWPNAYTLP